MMTTLRRYDAAMIAMVREAKAARDAAGDVDPRADRLYAEVTAQAPAPTVRDGAEDLPRQRGNGTGNGSGAAPSGSEPTDRQWALIARLCGQKLHGVNTDAQVSTFVTSWANGKPVTRWSVSKLIDWLMAMPDSAEYKAARHAGRTARVQEDPAAQHPEVRDGWYAVERPGTGGGNTTVFYRLRTDKRNGRRYLDRQEGQSYTPTRRDERAAALRDIAADPRAAGERYAAELGRCWVCGRTLTNDASRAALIGPECAKKNGGAA